MSGISTFVTRMPSPFFLLSVSTNMLGVIAISACDTTSGTPTKPQNAIEVTFAYSSEKQPWIDPLAAKFNGEQHKMPGDNRPIYITAQVWDSGTAEKQIANKTFQPTVWSPSNSLWKSVLNFEA